MAKETIRLRVPESDPEDPRPEFVSHGNFDFELVPGNTVATTDPRIAAWLVDAHGLEEIERIPIEPATEPSESSEGTEETVDFSAGYPEDFPGRDALIAADVPYETAVTLGAEQLAAYKGIGPKTADAIVEYVANGGEE